MNILLSIISILICALFLEIGTRIYKSDFQHKNFLLEKLKLYNLAYPAEFDSTLGWIPKRGQYEQDTWGKKASILAHGIRSNGHNYIKKGNTILVIGDSFTYGSQVNDGETWPAYFEGLIDRRVINAGVFGYGIDQSYLRMIQLINIYHPRIVIFSFIPDDIDRCELSARSDIPKPYFTPEFQLVFSHIEKVQTEVNGIRWVLGYSCFANSFFLKTFRRWWLQGDLKDTKVHSQGIMVANWILYQAQSYCWRKGIKFVVLVQYKENDLNQKNMPLIIRTVTQGVEVVIDSWPVLKDSHIGNKLFDRHMTAKGNFLIATILREHLK